MRLLLLFLFALATQGISAQPKHIELCCTKYENCLLYFTVLNNSDSIVKFQFLSIEKKDNDNLVKSFNVKADTLIVQFLDEYKTRVSSSEPINYKIDGEPYNQRTIQPHKTIVLAVKANKRLNKRINYIKVLLPNNQEIITARNEKE